MIDFSLMNKALKCVWVKRFNSKREKAWRVIPDEATSHKGSFSFLLSCNCNCKDANVKDLPLFYERMLQYWHELREAEQVFQGTENKAIIWNNRISKLTTKLYSCVHGLIKILFT